MVSRFLKDVAEIFETCWNFVGQYVLSGVDPVIDNPYVKSSGEITKDSLGRAIDR